MTGLVTTANFLKEKYLPLVKSRQTILLTLTGAAGYLSQSGPHTDWLRFAFMVGSLMVTISGCTVLNMLFDRDIDRKMVRTRHRPMAEGRVSVSTATMLGSGLITIGLIWSALLSLPYFAVVLVGAFLNVLVYTLWLKRRSIWSIVLGGVAGGMPILAGRVLAIGGLDWFGLLLALVIVVWIPSHNMSLSIRYSADYLLAGIPTVVSIYGEAASRLIISSSSLLVGLLMLTIFVYLGYPGAVLYILLFISLGWVGLAILAWIRPTESLSTYLYKVSSLYILASMLLLSFGGLG